MLIAASRIAVASLGGLRVELLVVGWGLALGPLLNLVRIHYCTLTRSDNIHEVQTNALL